MIDDPRADLYHRDQLAHTTAFYSVRAAVEYRSCQRLG